MADFNARLRRVFTSAKYGLQSAITAYRAENFVAEIDYDWDSQPARMARYWHNRRYADNTIYATVNRYADTFKFREKLYKHIRGLYNPVHRLINIETSKILGGAINYETFEDGALVLAGADERLMEAIRTIWQWSNLDLAKNIYVRNGSTMGDSFLKVVDDPKAQKVRLEVLDPRKVTDVAFDSVGNIIYCEICYERQNYETGMWYEYKETIDKEMFLIEHDNSVVDEYPNPYGFVPLRLTKHVDTGLEYGQTSYHDTRHKIDMVNDALSLLLNNIRMQVQTKFASFGAAVPRSTDGTPSTISISSDRQDQAAILEFSEKARLEPIVFPVEVTGALALAAVQIREIEADLPQLALQQMRGEQGNTSGVAIENLYNDAADIIGELQANYMAGLKAATQMAISMAAYHRYPQFLGFNLNSFDNGAIDFDIRPKPMFKDKLSTEKKIEYTMQAVQSDAMRLILPQLGYDKEAIEEIENLKADSAAAAIRGMWEGAFGDKTAQAPQAPTMQEREERLQDDDMQENENYATMEQE
jgi:hypothetical protein